jgi:hypothetical protein
MSVTPEEIRKILDELEASRASRKRAWENLQEIRWVLKETTGVDLGVWGENEAPDPNNSATRGYSLTAFCVPLLPRPNSRRWWTPISKRA